MSSRSFVCTIKSAFSVLFSYDLAYKIFKTITHSHNSAGQRTAYNMLCSNFLSTSLIAIFVASDVPGCFAANSTTHGSVDNVLRWTRNAISGVAAMNDTINSHCSRSAKYDQNDISRRRDCINFAQESGLTVGRKLFWNPVTWFGQSETLPLRSKLLPNSTAVTAQPSTIRI